MTRRTSRHTPDGVRIARREFLHFLAGSPLLLGSNPVAAAERLLAEATSAGSVAAIPELLASPADAINVFDFEPVAKRNLSPAHSLAAVAQEAGFADQAHFTRMFKSAYGVTPARYAALRSADEA